MARTTLWRKIVHTAVGPVEHIALQVSRAFIVSVLAAGLDVGIYWALVQHAHQPPVLSNTISYLVGGVLQYVLCTVWVFSVKPDKVASSYVVFSILSLVGLGISNSTVWLMVHEWPAQPMLAKIVSLGVTFCWNFTSRKYLIFRQNKRAACDMPSAAKHLEHEAAESPR